MAREARGGQLLSSGLGMSTWVSETSATGLSRLTVTTAQSRGGPGSRGDTATDRAPCSSGSLGELIRVCMESVG